MIRRIVNIFTNDLIINSLLLLFSVIVILLSWMALPSGGLDMREDILPSLVNWRAPWEEGTPLFPWAIIVLMPLKFLTPRMATALVNGISVILMASVIKKIHGNPLLTIPVMVSPFGYWLFVTGQTDVIVLASLLLPAGYDLFLFWKPQVAAHAYWVRFLRFPKSYIAFGSAIFIISWIIWGNWPLAILSFGQKYLVSGWWNRSLWPYSIPVGLFGVYMSIKNNDIAYGIIASPLLFPYVNGPSYLGLLAVISVKWPKVFWGLWYLLLLYLLVVKSSPSLNLPGIY